MKFVVILAILCLAVLLTLFAVLVARVLGPVQSRLL